MEYAFFRDVNDCKSSKETFDGVEHWVCFLGFNSAKGSRVTCSHYQLRDGTTDACRHDWTLFHRGVATTYASWCLPQSEMLHFTAMWSAVGIQASVVSVAIVVLRRFHSASLVLVDVLAVQRRLIHWWNADAGHVGDVHHHVRGTPP